MPHTSSSSSCILQVCWPEGEKNNWECYSPGGTNTMLQSSSGERYSSTLVFLGWPVLVIIWGPGRKTLDSWSVFSGFPAALMLSKLAAQRTGTLWLHHCACARLLPLPHSESYCLFKKKKSHHPWLYMSGFLPSPNTGVARKKESMGVAEKPANYIQLPNQFWKVKDHLRNMFSSTAPWPTPRYLRYGLTCNEFRYEQRIPLLTSSSFWSWGSKCISSGILPTV